MQIIDNNRLKYVIVVCTVSCRMKVNGAQEMEKLSYTSWISKENG